jgi:Spy/CpxP family protein refolding chaperone
MRRRVQIYLDHAKHLTKEQRAWLRHQEAKRANDKTRMKEARRLIR